MQVRDGIGMSLPMRGELRASLKAGDECFEAAGVDLIRTTSAIDGRYLCVSSEHARSAGAGFFGMIVVRVIPFLARDLHSGARLARLCKPARLVPACG